jgi:hypothetical protein
LHPNTKATNHPIEHAHSDHLLLVSRNTGELTYRTVAPTTSVQPHSLFHWTFMEHTLNCTTALLFPTLPRHAAVGKREYACMERYWFGTLGKRNTN